MTSPRPFPTIRRRDRPKNARWAALIGYDGRGFHGFQRQPGQRTIEGELVQLLQAMGLTGGLSFASRTDAGVHAVGQVIAFRAPDSLDANRLESEIVGRLPPDIRLGRLMPAPAKFHPRWSAEGKVYRYELSQESDDRAWRLEELDLPALETAARLLREAPGLDGFTAPGAPAKAAPALTALTVAPSSQGITLTFEGPAFRRYAIRHMVGALIACARGESTADELRSLAAATTPYRGLRAPAQGLTLVRVAYPSGLDPFA